MEVHRQARVWVRSVCFQRADFRLEDSYPARSQPAHFCVRVRRRHLHADRYLRVGYSFPQVFAKFAWVIVWGVALDCDKCASASDRYQVGQQGRGPQRQCAVPILQATDDG